MLRKVFLIMKAGFLFQFLMSCSSCGPSPVVELVHKRLVLDLYEMIDNQLIPTIDSVHKEYFALKIAFDDQEKELSYKNRPGIFGFNTTYALDCPPPNHDYSDKVKDISITVINSADSSQKADVTNIFGSRLESVNYSIKELIDFQYEDKEQFSLYLSLLKSDGLYKECTFRVTTTLESGEIFTQQTEEIIFME